MLLIFLRYSASMKTSLRAEFASLFNKVLLYFTIRDSGDSRGDRGYWIDPEWSGNSLKAFCDMTNDGGMLWIKIGTKICTCQSTVKGATGSKLLQTRAAIGTYIHFLLTFPTGLSKTISLLKFTIIRCIFSPFSLAKSPARDLQIPAYLFCCK